MSPVLLRVRNMGKSGIPIAYLPWGMTAAGGDGFVKGKGEDESVLIEIRPEGAGRGLRPWRLGHLMVQPRV